MMLPSQPTIKAHSGEHDGTRESDFNGRNEISDTQLHNPKTFCADVK